MNHLDKVFPIEAMFMICTFTLLGLCIGIFLCGMIDLHKHIYRFCRDIIDGLFTIIGIVGLIILGVIGGVFMITFSIICWPIALFSTRQPKTVVVNMNVGETDVDNK